MQYYTKQELQGAGRYTGKCRIGNWNENDTLDEVRTVPVPIFRTPFGRCVLWALVRRVSAEGRSNAHPHTGWHTSLCSSRSDRHRLDRALKEIS